MKEGSAMDMNLGTALTLALIAVALIPAVRQLVGKGVSSCDGCNGSCNSCNSCNAADKMVRDMKRAERKRSRRMRKQMRGRAVGMRRA
jgi:hypothetical protein